MQKNLKPRDQFLYDEEFIQWRLFRTPELDKKWNELIKGDPHLEPFLKDAIDQFEAVELGSFLLPESDKERIYFQILSKINQHKRKKLRRRVGSIAAVFAFLCLISAIYFCYSGFKANNSANEQILGYKMPSENIYIISGNRKTDIDNQARIEFTKDAKAYVTDSTDGKKELAFASTGYNTLVVPFGKRSELLLADGTKIWLNSGTQITFPSGFIGEKREIDVEGEIFLEVAKDVKRPFIVHAGNLAIEVLGTSFNISAYKDDLKKTVVLVDGKINVKTPTEEMQLIPNEKFELHQGTFSKEIVDVSEYVSWRKGILEFNEATVSEILKKIGRYYNVHFKSTPETSLSNRTCSGKLFLSNSLDSVMTSISILSLTEFTRENDIVHITKKEKPMQKEEK
jgi:hypothetical protein